MFESSLRYQSSDYLLSSIFAFHSCSVLLRPKVCILWLLLFISGYAGFFTCLLRLQYIYLLFSDGLVYITLRHWAEVLADAPICEYYMYILRIIFIFQPQLSSSFYFNFNAVFLIYAFSRTLIKVLKNHSVLNLIYFR